MIPLALSLGLALADWLAVATDNLKLETIAKPAVPAALIVWMIAEGGSPMFMLGLGLSLLGDVLLLPPHRRLKPGLAAFLFAHLAYIAALSPFAPTLAPGALAVIALASWLVTRLVLSRMAESNLRYALIAYALVLSLMVWFAWSASLRDNRPLIAAFSLAAGGTLFFISDSALAINRFVQPLPGGRIFEHITYHLAQICLAGGMLLARN